MNVYHPCMDKNAPAPPRPRDMNQLAQRVAALATGEEVEAEVQAVDEKARKRGEARAEKLSPERRSAIARKAAQTRWKRV